MKLWKRTKINNMNYPTSWTPTLTSNPTPVLLIYSMTGRSSPSSLKNIQGCHRYLFFFLFRANTLFASAQSRWYSALSPRHPPKRWPLVCLTFPLHHPHPSESFSLKRCRCAPVKAWPQAIWKKAADAVSMMGCSPYRYVYRTLLVAYKLTAH